MSVNSYLVSKASSGVLSSSETAKINTSIFTLDNKLKSKFGSDIITNLRFGSSTRGTILPRALDSKSDIDYMIVFTNQRLQPNTYLARLKRFAEENYGRSLIRQDHPTIVLELNRIKFDLVPAQEGYIRGQYYIPNKNGGWQSTNPNGFNDSLVACNRRHSSLIKPTVRLFKYWNACNGYLFESFAIEQFIVNDVGFWFCTNQMDYFFRAINTLNNHHNTINKTQKVQRAKRIITEVRGLIANGQHAEAKLRVKKLIP